MSAERLSGRGEPRPLLLRAGKRSRPLVNDFIVGYSEVGDAPTFDPASFPWMAELERSWPIVRAEAEAVVGHAAAIPPLRDISPDHHRIADGRWRSFFLWGYGYKAAENCARCPETTRLVEAIPGLNSAFFSILAPGIHIPRHKGVTKRLLTCHLGIIVPRERERCRIALADQILTWEEGRCLVFDDTYPHEIWNDTEETRVVLLIQFKRPLRQPGRLVGDLFLTAVRRSRFVQEARRNLAHWERAFREAERG